MVTVALAGGSSGLGRTMLWTFIRHNTENKHKLVLLSRTAQPEFSAAGVDVRLVDYSDRKQVVDALRHVDTLISLISGSYEAMRDAQLALVEAAKEAGVRRFAPSEFAGNGYEGVDLYAPKAEVWEAAKKAGFECTRFNCGLFMSILATGTPKPMTSIGEREGRKSGQDEALSGLRPWKYVVDVENGNADLVEGGKTPLVLTDMRDIALFVFRALDLDHWPEDLGMRGDVKSFEEIVEICERIQGRKWLIKDRTLEEVEKGTETDQFFTRFYHQSVLQLSKGWAMVGDDLNRSFPDVKPTTVEEFVQKWWGGLEFGEPKWGDAAVPDRERK